MFLTDEKHPPSSQPPPPRRTHSLCLLPSFTAAAAEHDDDRQYSGLVGHLASIIKFRGGPITMAEYMHEALTHQEYGYYMNRDVFGKGGDFITSPEISQVFGELMGVWAVSTWQQMGRPSSVNLVELGPGRGTLMADLLRGTASFKDFVAAATVHMVEVSPTLRKIQRAKLQCGDSDVKDGGDDSGVVAMAGLPRVPANPFSPGADKGAHEGHSRISAADLGMAPRDSGISGINGCAIEWHDTLDTVRAGPTVIIAHEFFDAMPVHQFQRTERGWCERLVTTAGTPTSDPTPAGEAGATGEAEHVKIPRVEARNLQMVLSPGTTPAGHMMIPRRLRDVPDAVREGIRELEVSPRSLAIWERIAERIEEHGGAALAIDYGEEGPLGNTLQGIRGHEFCHVLDDPGDADLSAYVDFGALRQVSTDRGGKVECYGPVTQQALLMSLGIGERLAHLAENADSEEQVERLVAGCERLVGGNTGDTTAEDTPPGMGIRYKAIAMVSKGVGRPVGFHET